MRNDARPIGTDIGHQSPVDPHHSTAEREEGRSEDGSSAIVNQSRGPQGEPRCEPDVPADDATLKTKI